MAVITRIEGTLVVQRGTLLLQGAATARDLDAHVRADIYNEDAQSGYQRAPIKNRIKGIAEYYRGSEQSDGIQPGRMPNPLLLNIRDTDYARGLVKVKPTHDAGAFKHATEAGGNWIGFGTVEFERDTTLWIYDGQHRMDAVRQLLSENDNKFLGLPIPVSITINLRMEDERFEFYQINTNAKSVSTTVAQRLMLDMADEDPALQIKLVEKGQEWISRGQKIAAILKTTEGPWTGRFTKVNERRAKNDPAILHANQFARSLKPVLDLPMFKNASDQDLAEVLNAYWTAISEQLPEAFEHPQNYVIQKSTGVAIMHYVLPDVAEIVRSTRANLRDPNSYRNVLKDIGQLTGPVVRDGQATAVDGSEYWGVGSAISVHSADSGRRRVASFIRTLLPPIEMEAGL